MALNYEVQLHYICWVKSRLEEMSYMMELMFQTYR